MNAMTVSERLAHAMATSHPEAQVASRRTAERLLLDVVGICLAARHEPYVLAALASLDATGSCTAMGHETRLSAEGAAFVNGIAAHGEDFDDTYEGGPVHAGAVIVPVVLAAAQRHSLSGADVLRGIAHGVEVMCRLCAVAPTQVHKAGFHPTAIFGAVGSVVAVGSALRISETQMVNALGLAGSMASGIIEYLADGSWTKRMHPGWAAQSGYRAVRMAQSGFMGPRTVFEGTHGLFHGFANTKQGNFEAMLDGYGRDWWWHSIAFKPYACGTMAHPYIDCARALRRQGISPTDIVRIDCDTAEGIVHRLWEPAATKAVPPNAYAAKFSVPYAIACGFILDDAGLSAYTDTMVQRADLRALAAKVHYTIDPQNPYPKQFTGHVSVTLKDGSVHTERQGFFKGGADNPLSDEDLNRKFLANAHYGGFSQTTANALLGQLPSLLSHDQLNWALFSLESQT